MGKKNVKRFECPEKMGEYNVSEKKIVKMID